VEEKKHKREDSTQELVELEYFQHLAQLDDKELIKMLSIGLLPLVISPEGAIRIDIKLLTPESLGGKKSATLLYSQELPESEKSLIRETVSKEVLNFLDSAINDAVAIASLWNTKESSEAK